MTLYTQWSALSLQCVCRGQSKNLTCVGKPQLICCCLLWATVEKLWYLFVCCCLSALYSSPPLSFWVVISLSLCFLPRDGFIFLSQPGFTGILVLQLWQRKDFWVFFLPGCLSEVQDCDGFVGEKCFLTCPEILVWILSQTAAVGLLNYSWVKDGETWPLQLPGPKH